MLKTFWCGVGGWRDRQLPDGTVIRVGYTPAKRPELGLIVRYAGAGEGIFPFMPLHYVDPNKKRGPLYRANVRIGRTRLGRAYGLRIGWRIDPWLYRATGGRYPASLPVVASAPLMTTGAKTGHPREVQLTYFHDGPDPI